MMFSSVLILAITFVAAEEETVDCPEPLPWNLGPQDFPDLSEEFHSLLRCPEGFNGCSDSLISCTPSTYMETCSCASNCVAYRDCCWEARVTEEKLHPPPSCTVVWIRSSLQKYMYMVRKCDDSWPENTVRDMCENAGDYQDAFYRIPVTSPKGVTYVNGFCALCNHDLNGGTFWNATDTPEKTPRVTELPNWIDDEPNVHLRPCSFDTPIENCTDHSLPSVVRKCQMYFAPVTLKGEPEIEVYKNVYCAMCNGVDLSNLTCAEPRHLSNFSLPVRRAPGKGPNLAAILRPIVTTRTCFAEHSGVCYIKSANYRLRNRIAVDTNDSTNSSHTVKELQSSYSVQSYLTIICVSLSLLCLLLKGMVFVASEDTRSFSTICTICLSATLFGSQLLFLLVNSFSVPPLACNISAVVLHYGFLSTFFWTSVLTFDIWRSLSDMASRVKSFVLYSLVAWGSPLVVVSVAYAVDLVAPESILAPRYGTFSHNCWISSLLAQVVFFIAPMALLVCFDVGLYVKTVIHIKHTAKSTARFESHTGKRRSYLLLFVKLALIMGLTWIVGFVGAFVNSVVVDVLAIVLVGLQGVFLFFGFKDYRRFRKLCTPKESDVQCGLSSGTATSDVLSLRPSGSAGSGVSRKCLGDT